MIIIYLSINTVILKLSMTDFFGKDYSVFTNVKINWNLLNVKTIHFCCPDSCPPPIWREIKTHTSIKHQPEVLVNKFESTFVFLPRVNQLSRPTYPTFIWHLFWVGIAIAPRPSIRLLSVLRWTHIWNSLTFLHPKPNLRGYRHHKLRPSVQSHIYYARKECISELKFQTKTNAVW